MNHQAANQTSGLEAHSNRMPPPQTQPRPLDMTSTAYRHALLNNTKTARVDIRVGRKVADFVKKHTGANRRFRTAQQAYARLLERGLRALAKDAKRPGR